jgi:intraflagellar transport protein 122
MEIKRKAPIWCLEWSPLTAENPDSLLTVGTWDQTITFWDINGKQVGADKPIGFDPLSINYFANGDFFVLSGTNKKASLWTREGGFISNICEKKDWIWSLKIKPKQMIIATSTNDGNISMHQITSLIVHGLYQVAIF